MCSLLKIHNDSFDKSFLFSEAFDLDAKLRNQIVIAHASLLLHVVCSDVLTLQSVENLRLVASMAYHDQGFLSLL